MLAAIWCAIVVELVLCGSWVLSFTLQKLWRRH